MLTRVVAHIAAVAGWLAPSPDREGVVTFRLAEGMRLNAFTPDGRAVILWINVCLLPKCADNAAALVEKALRLSAATANRQRSILSLSPPFADPAADPKDRLLLHRTLHPAAYEASHEQDRVGKEAQDLLNDFMWWREQLCDTVHIPLDTTLPGATFFSFTPKI